jgi:hypothetical protein
MLDLKRVWSIQAEGKVKFFFWLSLQSRNWTADRLGARGWPHDDNCGMCNQHIDIVAHMALHNPFAREVWVQFLNRFPDVVHRAIDACSSWEDTRQNGNKCVKRKEISLAFYTIRHI